jgi:hypothetical protein
MKLILMFLVIMFFLIGCTDTNGTVRTLKSSGYTEISVGGYDWFSCGEDDWSATTFHAKNPNGEYVSGTVCCGLFFKGCTVRY